MIQIKIKVTPNARKNEILSFEGDILKCKIKGSSEKGTANEDLIEFISSEFKVPKSNMSILSGHTSRLKKLNIENLNLKLYNGPFKNGL